MISIVLLEVGEHRGVLVLLLLLRSDDEEVEDREQAGERQELNPHRRATAAGRSLCPGDVDHSCSPRPSPRRARSPRRYSRPPRRARGLAHQIQIEMHVVQAGELSAEHLAGHAQMADVSARHVRQTSQPQVGSIGWSSVMWRARRMFTRPAAVKQLALRPFRVGSTQSKRSYPMPINRRRSCGSPTPIR
jgi:hypothetical protein